VMDVIPLDANLVKGSHGRVGVGEEYQPVLITTYKLDGNSISADSVFDMIMGILRK